MKIALIYIYNFLHYAGDSISEVFSAVLLYNLGFDISHILFFLGLKWGIMGLLTPLAPVIASRIGYFRAGSISIAAILAANLVLVTTPVEGASVFLLGILLVLYGIGGAFTAPIRTTMNVLFIPEKCRGVVNGRIFAIRALSVMSTSFIIGFFLGNSTFIILALAITLGASLIPLGILFHGQKRPAKSSYFTSFITIGHRNFRRYVPIFALRAFMHTEKFLIPLYIFLVVGDLQILAIYIILSTMIEIAVMLIFGTRFDHNRGHTLFAATFFRSLSSVFLILRPIVEKVPIFCQIFSRITGRGHDNIYQAFEQRIIKKSGLNPTAGSATVETVICFSELIACVCFGFAAITVGHNIFFAIFIGSIIAAWLIFFALRRV
jgi:hypothetical protein